MILPNFTVGVSDGHAQVVVNERLEVTDVERMLSFEPENIEDLLRTHSGTQAYWEALTVRLRTRYEIFKDSWCRKWWAHSNRYARVISAVYGEPKPAAGPTQDLVIQIFSVDTPQVSRERYAYQAWAYEVKKSMSAGTQEEYAQRMFKYLNSEQPWYFETIVGSLKAYLEEYEMVSIAAKRLNSKAYDMGLYTKLQMAKRGNVGQ